MKIVDFAKYIISYILEFKGKEMKLILSYANHIKNAIIMMFFAIPLLFISLIFLSILEKKNKDLFKKTEKKLNNFLNPMIDKYYESQFEILKIKHPDWFKKA